VGVSGTEVAVGVDGTGMSVGGSMVAVGVAGASVGMAEDVEVGVDAAVGIVVAVGALAVRVAKMRWATVASSATASGVGSARAQPASAIAAKMNNTTSEDFMRPSTRNRSG
jgi:hypothetical protein